MWNSLRFRLIVILIGLAIGPLILVGGFLGQRTYNAVRDQTLSFQVQVAQSVSLEVEKYFQNVGTDLNSLGEQISGLSQPDRAQLLSVMLNAISSSPYQNNYNELILLNGQGFEQIRVSHEAIVPSNQLIDQSTAAEFTEPAASRATYYSPVQFDPKTGNAYMTIAIPLYGPHSVKLLGVLIASLRFSAIDDLIAQVQVGAGQTVYITNSFGELVAHQDRSVKLQGVKVALPTAAALQKGFNGADVALGVHKFQIGDQEFNMVAERPVSEAMALANSTALTIAIILLVSLLAAILLVVLSVRQIVLPIEGLAATAKLIEAGDFSQKAVVRSQDEIGVLASAFNGMTSQLRTLIESLERRVADRTKALATSSEVSRRLSTILDRKELVTEVVNQVKNAFGYYHTQIYFYDAANENLVMAGGTGKAGELMLAQFHKVAKGRGLVGRAAETNKPVLVPDTAQNSEWLPNILLPDTKSEVAIPISVGNQVMGVLDVQQNIVNGLEQEDVSALQSIANQIAIALQNILSTETVAKRATELQTVAQISTVAATISDVQKMLESVVHLTQRGFGLYHAHVFLYNENAKELQISACGWKEGDEHEGTHGTTVVSLLQEQSLVARAARARQAVIVNDVHNEPGWLPNPMLPDTASELAVPLIVGDQLLGVLDVQSNLLHAFSDEDASIQTTLASQVATAIQNARSFSQSQRQAEREAAVNLISQKIQGTTSIDEALQIAARELGHVFGKETRVKLDTPGQKSGLDN